MHETGVLTLGQEDSLEKETATHSSILTWRIPQIEDPGGLQSTGLQRVGHDWATELNRTEGAIGSIENGIVHVPCKNGGWCGRMALKYV